MNNVKKPLTPSGSDIINAISPIYLGKADGGGINGFYNGNISNLKLYSRALTDAEIKQNYNAHKGRFGL